MTLLGVRSKAGTLLESEIQSGLSEESFRLRSYQAEMVEESLKSNIICVMETGSGKTYIAIERARIELETCQPEKKVWFLAPTTALLKQQHQIFQEHLPSYGCQMLCGDDNVDSWTDQSTWDAILRNTRIVLSTYKVLLDALTHAFVKMEDLALLILDEAHHCTRNHPAYRIMSRFYRPRLKRGHDALPRILGLSATPIKKAKRTLQGLQQIEQNLCATAKSPRIHRMELMQHVHVPTLSVRTFRNDFSNLMQSKMINELRHVLETYDLQRDPYVLSLLKQQSEGYNTSRELQKVFVSRKTYCYTQLKSLVTKAEAMLEELGLSSAEWFVRQCVTRFEARINISDSQLLDWSDDEKQHLSSILQRLPSRKRGIESSMSLNAISQKVELLIAVLIQTAGETPEFRGLVFVGQRVWVAALAEILSSHPQTTDLFRVATFVGSSQSSGGRADIATLAEPKNQQTTIDDFRNGKINLILTTSVLEEGIDVSSCHLVVCFEEPKSMKSFIQSRGRARMQDSKYIIFTSEGELVRRAQVWQSLEEEMKAIYLDDMREVRAAYYNELEVEEGQRLYRVPKTGALLTLDNALEHLNHFCTLLGSGPYQITSPQFDYTETTEGSITARVVLPMFVDPAVRTATSIESWRTERMAKNDAAFEAYRALHAAGLVNDNLLPDRGEADEAADPQIQTLVSASTTLDPWPRIARYQAQNPNTYHRSLLKVRTTGGKLIHMVLFTPTRMPAIPQLTLYWNESERIIVDITPESETVLQDGDLILLKQYTLKVLQSIYYSQMDASRADFLFFVAPSGDESSLDFAKTALELPDTRSFIELLREEQNDVSAWGLVREGRDLRRYVVKAVDCGNMDHSQGRPDVKIQAMLLPKRRDFLHPIPAVNAKEAHTKIVELDAFNCVVERMPAVHVIFALLFPSILYRLERGIVAETLMDTLLAPVAFSKTHLALITHATTSSQTGEDDNYQRLEFLGDCVLKFIATVHLLADKPLWPEGLLTAKKSRLVCNSFLARATLAAGLDQFITTRRFTGAKWRPRYAGDLLAETGCVQDERRSSKLLADVVESLIGASYVAGGLDKAFVCVQTLLPFETWTPTTRAAEMMNAAVSKDDTKINFGVLEDLVRHSFSNKMLLLEALTHGSYIGPDASRTYERLEFLGDAVLDYVVSKRLYAHESILSHAKMHGIRTALVNAQFLAFKMFETTEEEETTNETIMQPELQSRALWHYLRSSSLEFNIKMDAAYRRYLQARDQINMALERNARFPWHLLSLLDAPKVMSDIVESVIGAIYIDARGDITVCENFIRRIGILDCLQHITDNAVDCLHPKERLGHLVDHNTLQYMRVVNDDQTIGSDNQMYRCQVMIEGVNVGGVVEGMKKLNAETIAAWKACEVLEEEDRMSLDSLEDDDDFFDAEEGGGFSLEGN